MVIRVRFEKITASANREREREREREQLTFQCRLVAQKPNRSHVKIVVSNLWTRMSNRLP